MRYYLAAVLLTALAEPNHFAFSLDSIDQSAENTKPVSVEVIDADTNQPLTEFTFSYWIRTPDAKKDSAQEKWQTHKSATGILELRAPISCELTIGIKAPEYLSGYGKTYHSFDLTTDNKDRKFLVKMQRGVTVKGTVLDAKTNLPVKGAKVMPVVFRPPLFSPDRDRAVLTDRKGSFTLRGVDAFLGAEVAHADYLKATVELNKGFEVSTNTTRKEVTGNVVLLESGETILGKVSTPDGHALAGVAISDGASKEVKTDKDGNFVLRSPEKRSNRGKSYYLQIEKEGFISQTLNLTKVSPNGVSVVLEPLYEFRGRVLGADQKLVKSFTVTAGPGRNPPLYLCKELKVSNGAEGFFLRLEAGGEHWVGVRADGYACWEGWTSVARNGDPLTIVLNRGFCVTGKAKLPNSDLGTVEITLAPRRPDPPRNFFGRGSAAGEFATLRTKLASNGSFRFDRVRPDDYVLTIAGERVADRAKALHVGASDIDAGVFELAGVGQIVGQIFHPPGREEGPWAFQSGTIKTESDRNEHRDGIRFKSDEKGRFQVENVSAGANFVSVYFPRSADVIGSHVRIAHIFPGQTTEVQFFNPAKKQDVVFQFVIGDGSKEQFNTGTGMSSKLAVGNITDRKPMFHIRLTPTRDLPASYPAPDWHEISRNERPEITLPDITAGQYRLQIGDWLGSTGVHGTLYETVVDINAEQRLLRIPLGAGSLTGRVQWTTENRHRIHVMARSHDKVLFRTAYSDVDGYFCLRYLPEGRWTVHAHDEDAGFCHLGEFSLKREAKDIGIHKLVAGGTISGKVDLGQEPRLPDTVIAEDDAGFQIVAPDFERSGGKDFAFTNLWPGRWTLKLMSGESLLGSTQIELKDRAQCILRAQQSKN